MGNDAIPQPAFFCLMTIGLFFMLLGAAVGAGGPWVGILLADDPPAMTAFTTQFCYKDFRGCSSIDDKQWDSSPVESSVDDMFYVLLLECGAGFVTLANMVIIIAQWVERLDPEGIASYATALLTVIWVLLTGSSMLLVHTTSLADADEWSDYFAGVLDVRILSHAAIYANLFALVLCTILLLVRVWMNCATPNPEDGKVRCWCCFFCGPPTMAVRPGQLQSSGLAMTSTNAGKWMV